MSELFNIIDARIRANGIIHIQSGKCKNVTDAKCDVEREGDLPELPDVWLNAAKETDNYVTIVPKESSGVLIGLMDGQRAEAFVIRCSEVEKVIWKIGTSTLEFKDGAITFNGGNNNGMVLIAPLIDKLNALEDDINSLKQVFSGWSPVSQDGGAAFKAAAATWYGQQLQSTQQKDLENEKILQ